MGNYNLAIKFSTKALDLFPSNNKIKNNLIDILNYTEPKNYENLILQANDQILKLNSENDDNKFIKTSNLNNMLNKSNEIIESKNLVFNYPHTKFLKKIKQIMSAKGILKFFLNIK